MSESGTRAKPEAGPGVGPEAGPGAGPEAGPEGEVDAQLFGSLFVLAAHLARRADAETEPLGITSRQWLLLAILDTRFRDGSPTLTQAAAAYGTTRQNLTQIVAALQRRGWVRLVPDAQDRRVTRVELTDRIDVLRDPRREERDRAFLADAFAALSPHERRTLRDLVVRLVTDLAGDTLDSRTEPST